MRQLLLTSLLALMAIPTWPANADVAALDAAFSEAEIAIMREYFHRHSGGSKTKSPRKSKSLPPGIAKNLQRGKPLPPDIAKQHLPGDLQDALPPPPTGHERAVVDGKILLIEIATEIVVDVLSDVMFGN